MQHVRRNTDQRPKAKPFEKTHGLGLYSYQSRMQLTYFLYMRIIIYGGGLVRYVHVFAITLLYDEISMNVHVNIAIGYRNWLSEVTAYLLTTCMRQISEGMKKANLLT